MNKIQQAGYRLPQWKEFSRRVIEENQCRCSRCNRHESEGVTLQVHHTYYDSQLFHAPWNYKLSAFEVLCQGCHAKEHGHIMPMEGWEYIGYEDLEEPCFPCEYPGCGYELRYVHTIFHPKWGYLNVGSVHADKLTGTNQASEVENVEKRKKTMLESFLNEKKWRHFDNKYYREFVHFPITVTEQDATFKLSIFIPLPDTYQTLYEAQKAAFNICFNQSPQQFFQQYNIPYPEDEIRKPRSKKNPVIYHDQLSFAISNQSGKLVHVDSVQPDTLCNCVCPACGLPLKAENTTEQPNNHRFIHLSDASCENYFVEMYRRLALQLIEQNQQISVPEYKDSQAELFIPEHSITIKNIKYPAYPYDSLVTYSNNDTDLQLGILIDMDGTITDEQIRQIQQENIPTVKVSLVKQYNAIFPLKLKELQELLRMNSKPVKWIHSPQYDQQAQRLLQEKQSFLEKMQSRIQQSLNDCIIEGYEIEQCVDIYTHYDKYPSSIKRLFNHTLENTIERIIFTPTTDDLKHSEKCIRLIKWYQWHDTIQGINYELLGILNKNIKKHFDFIELAKQKQNHTSLRLELLQHLFSYYFINNADYVDIEWAKNRFTTIRNDYQKPFLKYRGSLSLEQKIGMELFFILYLYYGVLRFSWHDNKKSRMYQKISSPDNQPIFAAIGSLWFGHIFTRFDTDDLQTFIHTIATQHPKAAPWVLTYIENSSYREYCLQNNIAYQELEQYREEYYNIWIAGILYSALPYNYDKNHNQHELFPKVTLPRVST